MECICGMAIIWPILNLTLQKSNDSSFLILNNHFENRKTNSIGRNVKIEQKWNFFFLVLEKQTFLARFVSYMHTAQFQINR